MTEGVMEFIGTYIPEVIGTGVGMGSVAVLTAFMLGYAINKALSLVDDK